MNLHSVKATHAHDALRFLLSRADGDTRRALMAEHPLAYADLYPGVDMEVILSAVRDRLADQRLSM